MWIPHHLFYKTFSISPAAPVEPYEDNHDFLHLTALSVNKGFFSKAGFDPEVILHVSLQSRSENQTRANGKQLLTTKQGDLAQLFFSNDSLEEEGGNSSTRADGCTAEHTQSCFLSFQSQSNDDRRVLQPRKSLTHGRDFRRGRGHDVTHRFEPRFEASELGVHTFVLAVSLEPHDIV